VVNRKLTSTDHVSSRPSGQAFATPFDCFISTSSRRFDFQKVAGWTVFYGFPFFVLCPVRFFMKEMLTLSASS
jgi:hypothetical protein